MGSIEPGRLVVAAIPILIGLYATLLGLGIPGHKPDVNPLLAARLRRQRWALCVLGPGAIAFGLYTIFSRPPAPEVAWQRCASEDGVCTVEFPARPKKEVTTVKGTTHHDLIVQDEQQVYRLTCVELSRPAHPETVEEQLDSMRGAWELLGRQSEAAPRLVGEEKISQDGVPGRELKYTTPENLVIWIRVFLKGKRLYRLLAAAPLGEKEVEVRRFLDSVRFKDGGK